MPFEEEARAKTTIFDTIRQGNLEALENIVKRGASINEIEKSKDAFTPLHCACYFGSLECLHWLLWKGADTTILTPKGWTPTHIAAIRGQYACIQALIQNGININAKDNRNQTPSHLAATHGNSHTLQAIIRCGADIAIQDVNGWTPVHTAAYYGRLGCMQFLKTAGGKLDECDNDGNTPAHLAAMEGNLPCLKYTLSNNRGMVVLNARNDQGDTPKTLAEQFFKTSIVDYLEAVEWERDHPEQSENLAFPAHVAAYNGDIGHLRLLIEQGVINVNERDDKGCTPAHKAAGQGHLNVLQWLIENGANVNIKNSVNETPRDIAIRFKQLACARLLECETIAEADNLDRAKHEDDDEQPIDSTNLTKEQKAQAKGRAKKKVEELERLMKIARSNFEQLGGRNEEINAHIQKENATIRTINELESELESERLRRERLEAQLDQCRQEIEKCVRKLREYEDKIDIMERYYHQMKIDPKDMKPKKKSPVKPLSRKDSNSDLRKPAPKRSESTLEYLNLTKEQLKDLRSAFNRIDRGRGFISVNELSLVYEELGIDVDEGEIQSFLKMMQARDGKIEFEDFAETTAKFFYRKFSKEEITRAFSEYDKNDSGYISKKEFKAVIAKKGRNFTKEEIDSFVDSVDKDDNGKISIKEFAALLS